MVGQQNIVIDIKELFAATLQSLAELRENDLLMRSKCCYVE